MHSAASGHFVCTKKINLFIFRLEDDNSKSLLALLGPLGILLKDALDQTEPRDNSYQVQIAFLSLPCFPSVEFVAHLVELIVNHCHGTTVTKRTWLLFQLSQVLFSPELVIQ